MRFNGFNFHVPKINVSFSVNFNCSILILNFVNYDYYYSEFSMISRLFSSISKENDLICC